MGFNSLHREVDVMDAIQVKSFCKNAMNDVDRKSVDRRATVSPASNGDFNGFADGDFVRWNRIRN